jgi:cardiolipin synthase
LHQLTALRWVVAVEKWALWATMALTVVSGLHYAWLASRRTSAQTANGASAR